MNEINQRKNLFKSVFSDIKVKYKIVVTNELTFDDVFIFRLSRMNLFMLFGFVTIFSIAFTIFMVWITPLKEYIPGYASVDEIKQVYINQAKIDSLRHRYDQEVKYRENFQNVILMGKSTEEADTMLPARNSDIDYNNISDNKSLEEKKLQEKWDKVNSYDLVYTASQQDSKGIGRFVFYTPVHGTLTNGFDPKNSHYGVDIVCKKDAVVKSSLDGRVIFSEWTYQGGYIITIQHDGDLVSSYKHNASLLKKQGDIVKAGDPISIIGNTGKLSSGPHLHFELWYENNAVNPADFINFD